jgi:hypothetical protein
MHKVGFAIALTGALLVVSSAADAQSRRVASISAREMPPAGMCRVWFDGVSADRQPLPTDCATARTRALREGGRVIYGGAANGGVYGRTDPRYDPRNAQQNDPRYDPRNRQQTDSRYDSRYDPRYDARAQRARDEWNRKAEKERYKAERKRQKEWDKSRRRDDRNEDRDDDRDDDRRGRVHDRDDD